MLFMAHGEGGQPPARARITGLPLVAFAALALVLLLAGVVFWASITYTVVDEGELLPWDVGPVYQVELFDRLTIYASGETALATDALTGFLLAATAGVSLLAYALLSGRVDRTGRGRASASSS